MNLHVGNRAFIYTNQLVSPMTTGGVTYAQTRQIAWVLYAPRISRVTSAPVKSKVRWAYEERADFSPPVEAASTTTSTP